VSTPSAPELTERWCDEIEHTEFDRDVRRDPGRGVLGRTGDRARRKPGAEPGAEPTESLRERVPLLSSEVAAVPLTSPRAERSDSVDEIFTSEARARLRWRQRWRNIVKDVRGSESNCEQDSCEM
jgi:hypothetical protein